MFVMEKNEKITGYDAYCLYISLKSHFTTKSYDFFKYGKKKIKANTYLSRSDRIFFEKLAKRYKEQDIVGLIVANLLDNNYFWVGDFLSSDAEEVFTNWKKRTESLEYVFKQECDALFDFLEESKLTFDHLFRSENGDHPILLKFALRKEVSAETFAILNILVHFVDKWNDQLSDDPVWSEVGPRYGKYEKFLAFNDDRRKKFGRIVVDKVRERGIL